MSTCASIEAQHSEVISKVLTTRVLQRSMAGGTQAAAAGDFESGDDSWDEESDDEEGWEEDLEPWEQEILDRAAARSAAVRASASILQRTPGYAYAAAQSAAEKVRCRLDLMHATTLRGSACATYECTSTALRCRLCLY